MDWKYECYRALPLLAFVVAGAPAFLLYTGNAEPYVAANDLPGEIPHVFGGLVVLAIVGGVAVGPLTKRSFVRTGQAIGLHTNDGGLLGGDPELEGTIRGHPVRVETDVVSTGSGAQGSTSTTCTILQVELLDSTDDGLYVVEAADQTDVDVPRTVPDPVRTESVGEAFAVLGDPNGNAASEVLTPRVRDELHGAEGLNSVIVGDPTDTILAGVPEDTTRPIGRFDPETYAQKRREEPQYDPATVSFRTTGLILDPDTLESHLEAMAHVADATETADLSQRERAWETGDETEGEPGSGDVDVASD